MHAQRGFNLIELLIGLGIGLVGLLAIGQIMLTYSQQRATITQSMATQSNGVMALYQLERDLNQAGYGLMSLQNCPFISFNWSGGPGASTCTGTCSCGSCVGGTGSCANGPAFYNSPFGAGACLPGTENTALTTLPVRILDGGTGSDTIEVQYANSNSGVPGADIGAAQTNYADPYPVLSTVGFAINESFVANANNMCTLGAATGVDAAALTISHATTNPYNVIALPGGAPATSGWNAVSAADVVAIPHAFLANVGTLVSRRYQIGMSGTWPTAYISALQVSSLPGFAVSNLVDDIIFLKAQYGLAATAASTTVASWEDGSTIVNNSNANRVIAVRVGIVARSPLYEKNEVDAPDALSVLPAIIGTSSMVSPSSGTCSTDVSSREVRCTMPDRHFRYRAYSTIIPLKNVIWTR